VQSDITVNQLPVLHADPYRLVASMTCSMTIRAWSFTTWGSRSRIQ
jgi:hypothetical protein